MPRCGLDPQKRACRWQPFHDPLSSVMSPSLPLPASLAAIQMHLRNASGLRAQHWGDGSPGTSHVTGPVPRTGDNRVSRWPVIAPPQTRAAVGAGRRGWHCGEGRKPWRPLCAGAVGLCSAGRRLQLCLRKRLARPAAVMEAGLTETVLLTVGRSGTGTNTNRLDRSASQQ